MTEPTLATIDANEAVASVACRLSEVVAIYPLTPASPMGEHAEEWSVTGRPNLWGSVPDVVEINEIRSPHVDEAGGAMALDNVADPHTFESVNYTRLLEGWHAPGTER